MEADKVIYRFAEKSRARHRGDPNLPRHDLAEFKIAVIAEFRNIDKHIVSALRLVVSDMKIIQPAQEKLPFAGVFFEQRIVIILPEPQPGDDRLLQRHGRLSPVGQ